MTPFTARLAIAHFLPASIVLILLPACSAQQPADAGQYHREFGYVSMSDGLRLSYVVYRPTKEGRYPAVLKYDPYNSGSLEPQDPLIGEFLQHGYAFVGANVRGEGCSEGNFGMMDPGQDREGAELVEWIASQSWSDGAVGMVGVSYSGHTQIMTASRQPKHLRAIAAGALTESIYWDAFRPGGIFNVTFASRWAFLLTPMIARFTYENRLKWGDKECEAIRAKQTPIRLFWDVMNHDLYDDWWKARSLETYIDKVNVPTMIVQGWQDQQTQSTGGQALYRRLKAPKKLILQPGGHGVYLRPIVTTEIVKWMDHWLKGDANGVDKEPPVTIWWEVQKVKGQQPKPNWTSTYSDWPIREANWQTFYMTPGGQLSADHPHFGEHDAVLSYTFPIGTELTGDNSQFALKPEPSGVVTYRTPPLDHDLTVLGLPQVTLYVSAEQDDTDFMIVLHDIFPGGDIQYLQRGFLRASLRRIDPARSHPDQLYRPFDRIEKLVPGEVYEIRLSMPPVGAVIRQGHMLELAIMSPSPIGQPDWGLLPLSLAGRNSLHHSAKYGPSLKLPVLPGANAQAPVPKCGSLEFQPCRPARQ